MGDAFQEAQWIPETTDGTKPYVHQESPAFRPVLQTLGYHIGPFFEISLLLLFLLLWRTRTERES